LRSRDEAILCGGKYVQMLTEQVDVVVKNPEN